MSTHSNPPFPNIDKALESATHLRRTHSQGFYFSLVDPGATPFAYVDNNDAEQTGFAPSRGNHPDDDTLSCEITHLDAEQSFTDFYVISRIWENCVLTAEAGIKTIMIDLWLNQLLSEGYIIVYKTLLDTVNTHLEQHGFVALYTDESGWKLKGVKVDSIVEDTHEFNRADAFTKRYDIGHVPSYYNVTARFDLEHPLAAGQGVLIQAGIGMTSSYKEYFSGLDLHNKLKAQVRRVHVNLYQ